MFISSHDWFCLIKEKNYYPQVLLKECSYTEKEKKMIRNITDDMDTSFNDSDEETWWFLLMILRKQFW